MFKLKLVIPRSLSLDGESVEREMFYDWVWTQFASDDLLGIDEGTLLSEQAAEKGLVTESWTVDSGEAPRERDWVGAQDLITAELYFSSEDQAISAVSLLKEFSGLQVLGIEEQKVQDWDAEWKASFLNAGDGVKISPFWRVVPPWVDEKFLKDHPVSEKLLRINPGAGFGTGTHETTQLCLQAIGQVSLEGSLQGKPVLDFGSGSGILSISLALLGAHVDGVEIDPLAIENAKENAQINKVVDHIQWTEDLNALSGRYALLVANILRPVLLEFAPRLVERLENLQNPVILSGLIESDLDSVIQVYSELLKRGPKSILSQGEWRAIVF